MKATLTLGPVLFNWPPERWRDFYFRVADEATVDFVCVGEVVCSKRSPFSAEYFTEVIERLERGAKTVILSTLAMPTLERERRQLAELARTSGRLVEANDVAALSHLAGLPHAIGPYVNVYNEATLGHLVRNGASRFCLPPELPLSSVRTLATHAGAAAIEVLAFGRAPLAISARCYHARIHGLSKDSCQFVCASDADGLAVDTLDGEAFLSVNGMQTLSHTYTNALHDIPSLIGAGVTGLRLSPHTVDMVAIARLFRDVLDGRCDGAAADAALHAAAPGVKFSNGFLHAIEGAKLAPPSTPG